MWIVEDGAFNGDVGEAVAKLLVDVALDCGDLLPSKSKTKTETDRDKDKDLTQNFLASMQMEDTAGYREAHKQPRKV